MKLQKTFLKKSSLSRKAKISIESIAFLLLITVGAITLNFYLFLTNTRKPGSSQPITSFAVQVEYGAKDKPVITKIEKSARLPAKFAPLRGDYYLIGENKSGKIVTDLPIVFFIPQIDSYKPNAQKTPAASQTFLMRYKKEVVNIRVISESEYLSREVKSQNPDYNFSITESNTNPSDPAYRIKVLYFYPTDAAPPSDAILTKLQQALTDVQSWYFEKLGIGKTFAYTFPIQVIQGKKGSASYKIGSYARGDGVDEYRNILKNIEQETDTGCYSNTYNSKTTTITFIAPTLRADVAFSCSAVPYQGSNMKGSAMVTDSITEIDINAPARGGYCIGPKGNFPIGQSECSPNWIRFATAHELAHTFNVMHPQTGPNTDGSSDICRPDPPPYPECMQTIMSSNSKQSGNALTNWPNLGFLNTTGVPYAPELSTLQRSYWMWNTNRDFSPPYVPTPTSIPSATPSINPTDIPTPLPSNGSVMPSLSPGTTNPILGDINEDGRIDISDYNILVNCFGEKLCAKKDAADINKDGEVNEVDINIFLRSLSLESN